jgi:hypothetical protein
MRQRSLAEQYRTRAVETVMFRSLSGAGLLEGGIGGLAAAAGQSGLPGGWQEPGKGRRWPS